MLKTTGSPDKPAPSRNNSSRSVSSRNKDSRLVSRKNDGDDEIDGFGGNSVKHTKKLGKSKSQNLAKLQKLAKSQKLPKSGKSKGEKLKNLSKSGNSSNFGAKDSGQSFLTPKTRSAFNHLWLAFTKAPIF